MNAHVSRLLLAAAVSVLAIPAIGQHVHDKASPSQPMRAEESKAVEPDPHAGHAMPMPAGGHAGHGEAAQPAKPENPHAGHAMPSSPADAHQGHAMPGMEKPSAGPHDMHGQASEGARSASDLPVGREPAPPPAILGAADALFGSSAMAGARQVLAKEHGGGFLWKLMVDQAEYRTGTDGSGYGWDAEAWFGGDLNRLVIKSEGEGTARDGLEEAELQALYSRAVAPYTDLQIGLRQDVDSYTTSYATLGVETILPYWFKAEAALFISHRGDALARLEGTYDLLLTQQVVLQPNLEMNFAMQDVPGARIGSGLSNLTAGFRLRYDITRQFSPYMGLNFERSFGGTAGFRRAAGEGVEDTMLVFGIRAFL